MDSRSDHERILFLENESREHNESLKEILALLRPIADTYTAAGTIGKWLMALAVFISIVVGIIVSFKGIIK